MNVKPLRAGTLFLVAVLILSCGQGRTLEGTWTFTGPSGEPVEATFAKGVVTYISKLERFTLITSGTYTSDKPEAVTMELDNYELVNSTLTPQEEAAYRELPAYRAEYTVDWKSGDEFVLSQVVAPGRFRDMQPLIYRRKN